MRRRARLRRADSISRELREKILLENHFFLTNADTCRKWGITIAMLRRWKRESPLGDGPAGTFRDWLVAGLYSGCVTVSELTDYLDWVNHCRYSEEEVRAGLGRLAQEGVARWDGEVWRYNHDRVKRGGSIF